MSKKLSLHFDISEKDADILFNDKDILKIRYDNKPIIKINHPAANYVSAYIDDDFVGAFLAIEYTKFEYEAHCFLLKKSIPYSRNLAKMFIDCLFFKENVLRVTSNVMQDFKTMFNFCLKLGFKKEGVKRNCYLKNGIAKDVHIFGITRIDWKNNGLCK